LTQSLTHPRLPPYRPGDPRRLTRLREQPLRQTKPLLTWIQYTPPPKKRALSKVHARVLKQVLEKAAKRGTLKV